METSSFIVALWFVPVTVFLVIPLGICFCWLSIRCLSDLVKLKIPFFNYFAGRYYLPAASVQRRCDKRFPLSTRCTAVISDGKNTFDGLVANISQMGMCIMDIPASVPVTEGPLSVVFQDGRQVINLVADQRWLVEQKMGRMLGLKIIGDNQPWRDFVVAH